MAIEVKVSGKPQDVEMDYPYLGRAKNGAVVLFLDTDTGVQLEGGLVHYSKLWLEYTFTPLSPSETITLSNK